MPLMVAMFVTAVIFLIVTYPAAKKREDEFQAFKRKYLDDLERHARAREHEITEWKTEPDREWKREQDRKCELMERSERDQAERDRRRNQALRLREEQRQRLGGSSPVDPADAGTDVVLYYTANRPDGNPWLVWRHVPEKRLIEVCDAVTRTWAAAGWPAKYLTGDDLNWSDLDPADLDRLLTTLASPWRQQH